MSIFFLNRVIPKENESLQSYLYRTVRANYYEENIPFLLPNCKSLSVSNGNELIGKSKWIPVVKDIIKNLNQDIDVFVLNQYDDKFFGPLKKEDSKQRFFASMHYHRSFTKYCPLCIKQDNYHRLFWDVTFVTTCLKHNTQLIAECSNCKKRISQYSFTRGYCKCRYKYRNTIPIKVKDSLTLKTQNIFQSFLHDERKRIKRSDGSFINGKQYLLLFTLFLTLLRELPVKEFKHNSNYRKFKRFYTDMFHIKGLEIIYMNFIMPLIHELIISPEKWFFTILKIKDGTIKTKVQKRILSKKNRILKEIFKTEKGDLYKELYKKYNIDNKSDFRFSIIELDSLDRHYIGIMDAARLSGKSSLIIQTLCNLGVLNYKILRNNKKESILVEKESILAWLYKFEKCMPAGEVINMLGLTYKQFEGLINQNFLRALHGPTVDGYQYYYVEKEDVFKLERTLRRNSRTLSKIDENWISLEYAKSIIDKKEFSFTQIIQLALDKKVRISHLKSEPLIKGLYFSKDDIYSLRIQNFKKFSEEHGYSKREAQKIFNIKTNEMNKWLDAGLICIHSIKRKGSINVLHFNKNHVIEKLAELKGYTIEGAKQHLEKMEVILATENLE